MTARERALAAAPTAAVVVLTALAAFATGAVGGNLGPTLFLVLMAALVVGLIALARPAIVGVIAMLSIFYIYRVGAGSHPGATSGVSYPDVALAGASAVAIPSMLRTPELRRLTLPLIGLATYLAALVPTLLLNPSHRADLEAGHRLVLVGGAMVVGAWLARDGLARPALLMLLVAGGVVGAIMISSGAAHGFRQPAQPFGLNKNYGGAIQGDLAVVALVLGRRLGLQNPVRIGAASLFVGATLAAHSRGSLLGVCAGLFLVLIAGGFVRSRGTRMFVIAVAIGLSVFVFTSIRKQMDVPDSQFRFNSIGQRQAVEREVQAIWRTSPWDGVGLKYFNSGLYGALGNQPANNVVDNELAESGVIGLTGFIVLVGCAAAAGWTRRRDQYVVTGLALVIGHVAHGQVDIYWQAGLVPLPFIIFGMGLALPPDAVPARRAAHA